MRIHTYITPRVYVYVSIQVHVMNERTVCNFRVCIASYVPLIDAFAKWDVHASTPCILAQVVTPFQVV